MMRFLVVAIAGLLLWAGIWIALPLPRTLTSPPRVASLTLQDRNGLVLRSTRAGDGSLQRWLRLGEIDPDLLEAFVAGEDHRFYEHHGVDPRAVGRALKDNLRARRVRSGASTITMQLARLLQPGAGRTWHGKVIQTFWALRLEAHLSKQQILEQYLNRVPLGQGTVGVDAAAALYFNATAARLSLGQAALLAGLASGPSTDNPFVAPDRARTWRALVLGRIGRYGYANADALDRASREPLVVPRAAPPFLAPHFTSRVLQWLDTTANGGTWRTSLDLPLQTALEAEVRHTVTSLSDRGVREAALVVLDNATGELLAWVGSPDFWSDSAGQVDMVVSPRQPGSALKPFLYGLAFDRGYTPASVLPDVPRAYPTSTGPYQPRNYDRRFHGPVRAREALASSYNVPAVELADSRGRRQPAQGPARRGIRLIDAQRPVLWPGAGSRQRRRDAARDRQWISGSRHGRGVARRGVAHRWPRLGSTSRGGSSVCISRICGSGARRSRGPDRTNSRFRSRDAIRLPVPGGGQDGHESPFHR